MKKTKDRIRIEWMLKRGIIGGEWFDPSCQDWPDSWDADIVREIIDLALKGEKKRR